ncbi:Putative copper export protein [Rubrobacter radiotolerans]|uniref:CopD family protein n=1 Tax=Rubrobacter radiotolerans TaxID=42256 RepID=A0A023X398_RUBRA|nr:CopD family protein [Rubrobacter radiotolerans]AHY46485.1 Putative copper export protein [Rubrobacter radiotolerans]MDX5893892.1 CopD family protein [Rubrobacter radiotolerans]SMC04708.1 copper transport protein [Rubrobacter radiotolerans DSM 5868]
MLPGTTLALLATSGTHAPGGGGLSGAELLAGLAHGLAQFSAAFTVGLGAFALLVLFPARRRTGVSKVGEERLGSVLLVLSGGLLLAGLVELPVYAVRASGESLSLGLSLEALFGTSVGRVWLVRLAAGFLCAALLAEAIRRPSAARWLAGAAAGGVLLFTFTRQSHAVTAGGLLPVLSDLTHIVAASVWMGGVLGFSLLLSGPLRKLPPEDRSRLLGAAVRRFTRVASVAVAVLLVTGLYAASLHVPSLEALFGTPYGRALIMKSGLLVVLLTVGAINALDRGGEPFGRMVRAEGLLVLGVFVATGFLSTLPPPG